MRHRAMYSKHSPEDNRVILEYWRNHPNASVTDVARALDYNFPMVYTLLKKYNHLMPKEHTIAAHKARCTRKRRKVIPMPERVDLIERAFRRGEMFEASRLGYGLNLSVSCVQRAINIFTRERRAAISEQLLKRAQKMFRDEPYMKYANYCAILFYNPNATVEEVRNALDVSLYSYRAMREKYGEPAYGATQERYIKWRQVVEELERTHGVSHMNHAAARRARKRGLFIIPLNLVGEEYERYIQIHNHKRAGFSDAQILRKLGIQ